MALKPAACASCGEVAVYGSPSGGEQHPPPQQSARLGGGEIYCVLVFSKYTLSYLVVLSLITGIFPLKAVAGFMLITLKQISQIYLVEECVKPQPPNGIM